MGEVRGGLRDHGSGNVFIAAEALDQVARGAVGEECRSAARDGIVGILRRRALRNHLLVDPVLEVGIVHRNGLHPHTRVRQTAELGALAEVDARLVSGDLPRSKEAWTSVALAVERRDPERVDHVTGRDEQLDLLTGRDHHLSGRDNVGRRKVAGIVEEVGVDVLGEVVAELPPPLLADHDDLWLPAGGVAFDLDLIGVGLGLVEGEVRHGCEHGHDDHDDRRDDGPTDLQGVVVRDLLGEFVVAVVALHPLLLRHVDHGTEHEDADHPGDDQHPVEQSVDLAGVVALRLQRVEFGVAGAAGCDQADQGNSAQKARAGITHWLLPLPNGLHRAPHHGRHRDVRCDVQSRADRRLR